MIFKKTDSKQKQLNTLKLLLQQSTSYKQKSLIQKDFNILQSGLEAEKQNAYYIDFYLKDNNNLLVLHDIRIEHNGRSAQIDHILISRFGIELLESKSFKGELTINEDGSLKVSNSNKVQAYPNPLEQSRRHAKVVEELVKDKANLGKRVDLLGGIEVDSRVLINPNTPITNKNLPEHFVRADAFLSERNKEIDKIGIFKSFKLVSKMISIDTVKEIAQLLVDAHKPVDFDYAAKYKVMQEATTQELLNTTQEELNQEVKQTSVKEKLKDGDTCPFCSNKLVLRKGKNEIYFLGCSSFPKCRFSRRVAKADLTTIQEM
jgi:hypothetical protein